MFYLILLLIHSTSQTMIKISDAAYPKDAPTNRVVRLLHMMERSGNLDRIEGTGKVENGDALATFRLASEKEDRAQSRLAAESLLRDRDLASEVTDIENEEDDSTATGSEVFAAELRDSETTAEECEIMRESQLKEDAIRQVAGRNTLNNSMNDRIEAADNAHARKLQDAENVIRLAAIAKKDAEDKEIARLAAIAKKDAEDKEIARLAAIAKKDAEDREISRLAAENKKSIRKVNMAKETEERCLIAFRQACIARRDASNKESQVRSLADNAVHLAALAKKDALDKERDAERRSAAAIALVAVNLEDSETTGVSGEGNSIASTDEAVDVEKEMRRLANNSVSAAKAEREDSEEKEREALRLAAMAVKLAQSTLSEAEENKKEKRKLVLLARPDSQARLTKALDEIAAQFDDAVVKDEEAARGRSMGISDDGDVCGGASSSSKSVSASASASAKARLLQTSRRDSIPVPTEPSVETVSSRSRSNSPVRVLKKGSLDYPCAVRLTSVDGGRYPAEKRSFFSMFCTVPCFFLYSPLKRTNDHNKNHSLIYSTEEVLFDKDTERIFENNQVRDYTVQCYPSHMNLNHNICFIVFNGYNHVVRSFHEVI